MVASETFLWRPTTCNVHPFCILLSSQGYNGWHSSWYFGSWGRMPYPFSSGTLFPLAILSSVNCPSCSASLPTLFCKHSCQKYKKIFDWYKLTYDIIASSFPHIARYPTPKCASPTTKGDERWKTPPSSVGLSVDSNTHLWVFSYKLVNLINS